MPKPFLHEEDAILEQQIISTLMAGLKTWRPDLDFPQSYSDMQGCVRGLMQMFKIERLALPEPLRIKCDDCEGVGKWTNKDDGTICQKTCTTCKGKGWLPGT